MQSLDLKVLRFTNDEVCKNGKSVIDKLNEIIQSIIASQDPSVVKVCGK